MTGNGTVAHRTDDADRRAVSADNAALMGDHHPTPLPGGPHA